MASLVEQLREHVAQLSGPALAVCHGYDDADYKAFIDELNCPRWLRGHDAGNHIPSAWPAAGSYQTILLPLPKGRGPLELALAATCSVLTSESQLLLFGHNDFGIKSAGTVLQKFFSTVDTASIGGKGRIFVGSGAYKTDYKLGDFVETTASGLVTYPGLFAKGKLDDATALLIENLPDILPSAQILDYACGIGMLGRNILLKQPQAILTQVDYDPLAIVAAQQNLPSAISICKSQPANITGQYDLIISNPPIHAGQVLSYQLLTKLLAALPKLLTGNGAAYFVTQVTVPVAKLAAEMKLATTEVAASRSFRVTKITR